MSTFNTNRPTHRWTIENKINYWDNQYWHNIDIKVNKLGKEDEYRCTMTFRTEDINEAEYWVNLGKKVAEVMDKIELSRQLETVEK